MTLHTTDDLSVSSLHCDSSQLMPKHVPSFKHLIASFNGSRDDATSHVRERTVNDRLQSSRAHQHAVQREGATLLAAANDGERVWSIAEGIAGLGGIPIPGEGDVHPSVICMLRSQSTYIQCRAAETFSNSSTTSISIGRWTCTSIIVAVSTSR